MKQVPPDKAEIAWLVYDLELDKATNIYVLKKQKTVYTQFNASLDQITKSEAGNVDDFVNVLQQKLDEKLNGTPPINQTIDQIF